MLNGLLWRPCNAMRPSVSDTTTCRWWIGVGSILRFAPILLLVLSLGCRSREKAQKETLKAFQQGMIQAQASQEENRNTVLVRGPVKTRMVPWQPGLTLSRAIVLAQYQRMTDPTRIVVVRKQMAHPVDVRNLLRGKQDPELEAGDVIDIQ